MPMPMPIEPPGAQTRIVRGRHASHKLRSRHQKSAWLVRRTAGSNRIRETLQVSSGQLLAWKRKLGSSSRLKSARDELPNVKASAVLVQMHGTESGHSRACTDAFPDRHCITFLHFTIRSYSTVLYDYLVFRSEGACDIEHVW